MEAYGIATEEELRNFNGNHIDLPEPLIRADGSVQQEAAVRDGFFFLLKPEENLNSREIRDILICFWLIPGNGTGTDPMNVSGS